MEILGHIVTGPSVQPVPATTNEWLIKISGDLTAANEKIDRLILGAINLDGRVDKVEQWRIQVADDVALLPSLHDWRKAMEARYAGIRWLVVFLAGVISLIGGIIGAAVAILTGLAQALGGRHP